MLLWKRGKRKKGMIEEKEEIDDYSIDCLIGEARRTNKSGYDERKP
jgi:hypothetical protein